MRAVEDHHVDRPDVEARQRVQLTGTNHSIGLNLSQETGIREQRTGITHPASPALTIARSGKARTRKSHMKQTITAAITQITENRKRILFPVSCPLLAGKPFIDGLVVTARASTPDPIPNSAVKTLRADGTAS